MLTITNVKLVKLPEDNRTVDQRIADHMNDVKKYGTKQAIANRLLDGTLFEYTKENKDYPS